MRRLPRNIWANGLNLSNVSTDYSEEWIIALETFARVENKFDDLDYHRQMIQVLSEIEDRVQYPSVLPPERPSTTRLHSNGVLRGHNGRRRTMQVRYLLLMAQTGKSETLRFGAKQFLNLRQYRASVDLWVQAYEAINIPLMTASLWNVLRLRADQAQTTSVGEGHHYQTLCKLIENMSVVRADTEFHRDKAVMKLKHDLSAVEGLLNPIELSRDEIMKRMGDKWFNNPNRKMDYAHKMMALRQQKGELEEAIEIMESLCFAVTL